MAHKKGVGSSKKVKTILYMPK